MTDLSLRVVVLCGPDVPHRNTCATLIARGVNVVGICVADQDTGGLPLAHVRRTTAKEGYGAAFSQVAARVVHTAIDGRHERAVRDRVFDCSTIDRTLSSWAGDRHETDEYGRPDTLDWLRWMRPDLLVVHSPYWVGKKVREVPTAGLVIGGHPGITPLYRGSHSALWAIAAGHPEDVGCTVFLLDEGADTGVILRQERIEVEGDDTFITLGWKGMRRIAELQAEVIGDLEAGAALPSKKPDVPEGSYYGNPRLFDYLRYRRKVRSLRRSS